MRQIIWKQTRHLVAGTTLKNEKMKEDGNLALHTPGNTEAIIENREALVTELGITLDQCIFLKQTHSDHFVEVTKKEAGKGARDYEDGIEDCDACYTKESNLLIGVMTADCLPIILYDEYSEIIAVIHSGWQGTIKQITKKLMAHLIEKEHLDPRFIHAYFGPSIAFSSLEVGEEVYHQIENLPFDTSPYIQYLDHKKALIDNIGLNKAMLLQAGVLEHHITIDKNDTKSDNCSLFSYRRDHDCGRHFSYIMKKRGCDR